jgi:hypothetical protein
MIMFFFFSSLASRALVLDLVLQQNNTMNEWQIWEEDS